jgi:hypothetical protein
MKTTAMKTVYATILTMVITASYAFAGGGSMGAEGLSLLTIVFAGFVAMVVVFQLVPAVILLGGMLKALFSLTRKSEGVAEANNHKH